MTQAQQIKGLGCWGAQDGLLSVAEIEELMRLMRTYPSERFNVMEVGHYMGLSTCAIVHALREHPGQWSLTTIDAHIADKWVPATDPNKYFTNKAQHFADVDLMTLIMDTRGIQRLDGYDVVFYDGDHAEEQMRFTQMVMDSPRVKLFIFDDRDFDVPRECCELLRAAGWRDVSPAVVRFMNDKADPDTMTLGIYWRPNAH